MPMNLTQESISSVYRSLPNSHAECRECCGRHRLIMSLLWRQHFNSRTNTMKADDKKRRWSHSVASQQFGKPCFPPGLMYSLDSLNLCVAPLQPGCVQARSIMVVDVRWHGCCQPHFLLLHMSSRVTQMPSG